MIPKSKVFYDLTRHHLAWQIEEYGWQIGEHTYGHPQVIEAELAGLSIGRFCSIGPRVTIVLGNHRTDLVTTYPFRTLSHLWPLAVDGEEDHDSRGDVRIGNDVWLGANSTVLSGSEIGHGAVIGAHAVVRGAIPPYSVAVGNPAKVARTRFDEQTVTRLLRVAWWDWPDDKIASLVSSLLHPDINAFLDLAERA